MTGTRAFFAYASEPATRAETLREAARKIAATGIVATQTWEELRVAGVMVVDTILDAIRGANVFCCEITSLNHNVMFEVGFAIGTGKPVWPLLDEADADGRSQWERFRLLSTLGYVPYISSDDVRMQYLREPPHLSEPVLDKSIRPRLQPSAHNAIFYLRSAHPTDASRQLTRRLDKEEATGRRVVTFDPTETSVYPLIWFAQRVYDSDLVIAHLSPQRHRDSSLHNARAALVAGLAKGMGKETILFLEEEHTLAPLDYRDLAYVYKTSADLVGNLEAWLSERFAVTATPATPITSLSLETELRSINFGEPVAENEADQLASYFIETTSYHAVLERATTVFVGRKGAGKSANFLRAAEKLGSDKRNLVCVIQPSGYELESVVRLLRQFGGADERSHAIETLWQYLLMSEVARVTVAELEGRFLPADPGSAEADLIQYVNSPGRGLREEFAVRLERVVASATDIHGLTSVQESREAVTKALHGSELQELRRLLGDVLASRERVCVLIDNLDKAWDRTADLEQLAHLLLGLIAAVRKLDTSFQKKDSWRRPVALSLSVFLRSDIFEKVTRVAREPDKIPVKRLVWSNPELLLKIIEERYQASHPGSDVGELWEKYFVPYVRGVPTKKYIVGRILPRPRDIVQICSFALNAAIDRRHDVIDADDILNAEQLYSQFAFEALLVENGLTISELESVLFEFAGGEARLDPDWVDDAISRSGLDKDRVGAVITRLRQLSFLGIETRDGVFSYEEDARDEVKFRALARNLGELRGVPARYEVHPAFRPYLEIEDPEVEGPAG